MALALNIINVLTVFEIWQPNTAQLASISALLDTFIVAYFYFTRDHA